MKTPKPQQSTSKADNSHDNNLDKQQFTPDSSQHENRSKVSLHFSEIRFLFVKYVKLSEQQQFELVLRNTFKLQQENM